MNWIGPFIVSSTDSSAAATTKVHTFYTTASDGHKKYIAACRIERITDWAGGALTAVTCEVGKVGDTAKYVAALTDLFTGAKAVAVDTLGATTKVGIEGTAQAIDIKFTGTGANLSAATAGRLALYILVENIPRSV